jgi:hypothetical protein
VGLRRGEFWCQSGASPDVLDRLNGLGVEEAPYGNGNHAPDPGPTTTTPREFDILPIIRPKSELYMIQSLPWRRNCKPFALQAVVDANIQSTK